MNRKLTWFGVGVVAMGVLGPAAPARATEHLVEMIEVYSDATGAFQFVNLRILSDFQNNQSVAFLESAATGNTLPLIDMPPFSGGQQVLIGTSAVQDALGFTGGVGSVGVDILMPDNFFDPVADTLSYKLTPFDPSTGGGSGFAGELQEGAHQSWGAGTGNTLPIDGTNALVFGFHGLGLDPHDHIGIPNTNSPQNFSGESGSLTALAATDLSVSVNGVTNAFEVSPIVSRDGGAAVSVEDEGESLRITGNGWKQIDFGTPVTISTSTVLEFDFLSTVQGEIHGIGFANSAVDLESFELFGTQTFGEQAFRIPMDTPLPTTRHFVIPVGDFLTGSFQFLAFINDHDLGAMNGESVFSNVSLSDVPEPASATMLLAGAGLVATRKKRRGKS